MVTTSTTQKLVSLCNATVEFLRLEGEKLNKAHFLLTVV